MFSFDDGNSMTNALHWVATRPGAWQHKQENASYNSKADTMTNVVFGFFS